MDAIAVGVTPALELVVRAGNDELLRSRELVERYLRQRWPQAGARMLYATELVLEEWLTNVFRHGHASRVRLTAAAADDELELRFEDDGQAFDPAARPEPGRPRSLEDLQPGGLGLMLIRRFSRSWHHAREDGHNLMVVRIADGEQRGS
jgi:anti-sigma regulatory factor (Ser/Thr protein kinase)